MSSMITSQGAVVATAMAVSGTVIILALRLQKSQFSLHHVSSSSSTPILRSCLSSDEKKTKKLKKRVSFAKDVVDSCKDGEEYRKQQHQQHGTSTMNNTTKHSLKLNSRSKVQKNCNGGNENRGMPANRAALYNGILRDRVNQRLAYC